MPTHQFFKKFGYNLEGFKYPFPEGSEILNEWEKRNRFGNNHICLLIIKMSFYSGEYDLPSQLVPAVGGNCKHGTPFSQDESALFKLSNSIIVHCYSGDKVYNVEVFGRRTLGKNYFY